MFIVIYMDYSRDYIHTELNIMRQVETKQTNRFEARKGSLPEFDRRSYLVIELYF